jgi:hypothetical protein
VIAAVVPLPERKVIVLDEYRGRRRERPVPPTPEPEDAA